MAAVTICSDFGAPKNKVWHYFHCFPIYLPWSDGTRCHDLSFLNVEYLLNVCGVYSDCPILFLILMICVLSRIFLVCLSISLSILLIFSKDHLLVWLKTENKQTISVLSASINIISSPCFGFNLLSFSSDLCWALRLLILVLASLLI